MSTLRRRTYQGAWHSFVWTARFDEHGWPSSPKRALTPWERAGGYGSRRDDVDVDRHLDARCSRGSRLVSSLNLVLDSLRGTRQFENQGLQAGRRKSGRIIMANGTHANAVHLIRVEPPLINKVACYLHESSVLAISIQPLRDAAVLRVIPDCRVQCRRATN
jgi:hypothetical protein